MAYRTDIYDNSLIIDGWEKGIADDPFDGISDMRNINITSVPKEASVNFDTASACTASKFLIDGTVISADSSTNFITVNSTTGLENKMAIYFTSLSGAWGPTASVTYYIGNITGNTFKIYTEAALVNVVTISGTGTGSFHTYILSTPKYFTTDNAGTYYLLDSSGKVWTNKYLTQTTSSWTYMGNKTPLNSYTNGNGLVYFKSSNGMGYVFVFHNSSIDYYDITIDSWNYQWNPATGTVGLYNATPTAVLKTSRSANNSHEALLAPDRVVYFCDGSCISDFYVEIPNPNVPTWSVGTTYAAGDIVNFGVSMWKSVQNNNIANTPGPSSSYWTIWGFDPRNINTYIFDTTELLPNNDIANCLAYLGTNLLVGGSFNIIYPWDTVSNQFNYPIYLTEYFVSKMITLNTTTYIFVGNRGRIYKTNGSQVSLFKKIPDHISGTIEPYFIWGGVCQTKNQLYFSFYSTTNGNYYLSTYTGIWAIDLDTEALRLSNNFSYGLYGGYASALIAINYPNANPTNPYGIGLFIGWDSQGVDNRGIDKTIPYPSTTSIASIDSDLIPIGTYQKPRQFTQIEYRLTKPMVIGESITVKYRLDFSQSYTTIFTDSTIGNFSSIFPINFGNAQWVQFQIILNSTTSNPSYTRLKEIRLLGLVGPTMAQSQILSY
jgi:hypothetical protein